MEDYNYRGTPGKPKSKQDEGNDIEVRVYDAGDNTPCVSCILGGPYYGQNCSETGACSPTED